MSEPAVLFEKRDTVGVITLNQPERRNAMAPALLDAFSAAVDRVVADDTLRCVVLTGCGRCFSAGADLNLGLQRPGDEGRALLPHETSYAMYVSFLRVLDIEVPVIGALNGHAVGGGFGLSLLCDLRIVAEQARYGANFARLGLHSGLAISYLLPRLIGVAPAAELLFTGRLVEGAQAQRLGLASRCVPADQVLATAMALAEEIAANAPIAVRMMKQTFYEGLGWQVRQAALREAFAQAVSVQTEDASEGVSALLEKRTPVFRGR